MFIKNYDFLICVIDFSTFFVPQIESSFPLQRYYSKIRRAPRISSRNIKNLVRAVNRQPLFTARDDS